MMVPKRLKEARLTAGLSQEQLAQLAGIEAMNSRSQISSYESGRHTPTFSFVVRIAKILNYPESYFYTVDDDFAERILMIYRNRSNPDYNPYHEEAAEAEFLRLQLSEARGLTDKIHDISIKLSACFNKNK